MYKKLGLAVAAFALVSTAALAEPTVKFQDVKGQKVMFDEKGMALYTFDKDEKDKTNCYGNCAVAWPPLMATASDKSGTDWKVIDRTDGTKMWSYKGSPIYYWVKDTKPGDAGGESVPAWHLVPQ